MNPGLVIAGSVVFALAYLPIVVDGAISASAGAPGAWATVFPIGGAFSYLRTHPNNSDATGLAVSDAVGQALGVALLVAGAAGRRLLVPDRREQASLTVVPFVRAVAGRGVTLGLGGAY